MSLKLRQEDCTSMFIYTCVDIYIYIHTRMYVGIYLSVVDMFVNTKILNLILLREKVTIFLIKSDEIIGEPIKSKLNKSL